MDGQGSSLDHIRATDQIKAPHACYNKINPRQGPYNVIAVNKQALDVKNENLSQFDFKYSVPAVVPFSLYTHKMTIEKDPPIILKYIQDNINELWEWGLGIGKEAWEQYHVGPVLIGLTAAYIGGNAVAHIINKRKNPSIHRRRHRSRRSHYDEDYSDISSDYSSDEALERRRRRRRQKLQPMRQLPKPEIYNGRTAMAAAALKNRAR